MTARSACAGGLLVAATLLHACQTGTTVRRAPTEVREAPAGVLHQKWRTVLHSHELFEPRPQECAAGVVVNGTVITGSRDARIRAIDTKSGRIVWSIAAPGGIDGQAIYHPETGNVLVGADNGSLLALSPGDGQIRWRYKGEGAITEAPHVADGRVFVATAADKLYALKADDGSHLWEYSRDRPDGFTIHGYAGPEVHDNRLFAGFSDGFFVALNPEDGEILWARSLAAASDQFVDVDATPTFIGENVITASYSGGLYAVAQADGAVAWRLPIEGAGRTNMVSESLYFVTPRIGLHAANPRTGQILWRRGLPNSGAVSTPQAIGPYLVFSGSDAGVYVVERSTGRLLQTFLPGRGMCAGPAIDEDARMIYVLSNGGSLYAMSVSW